MGPQEATRLLVNIVTTGLALREHGARDMPPSQLAAGTALMAAAAIGELAGLPGQGAEPALVAASLYGLYCAWQTWSTPPHGVDLQAGRRGRLIEPRAWADPTRAGEWIMLAALADGAARAGAHLGAGPYAMVASALAPSLWLAARAACETGPGHTSPAERAANLPVKMALGLLGTVAATVAAERLGGATAAVVTSLWLNARVFSQDPH